MKDFINNPIGGREKMEKGSKSNGPSKGKKQNTRACDTTPIDFYEELATMVEEEDEEWLERRFNASIKDAQALIEIYCRSEGLKMEAVDFEIFIDGDPDRYWLSAKVGTAYDAMGLVSFLLKRRYAKYHLKVWDNSAGKTIFIMDLFGEKDWWVGTAGTHEEVDEWDKRNHDFKFSDGNP